MQLKRHIIIIFLFALCQYVYSQSDFNFTIDKFVKSSAVSFRLLPQNKDVLKKYLNTNIILYRYKVESGKDLEQKFICKINPFEIADTMRWMRYYRLNKNQASFLYQYLYPSKDSAINKSPNQSKTASVDIFNMAMIICDYSAEAARACGLLIKDSTTDNVSLYKYKFVYYKDKKEIVINSLVIDSKKPDVNPAITNFKADYKKNKVYFACDVKSFKASYSSYIIEKSTDNKVFHTINNPPIVYLDYAGNKQKYVLKYEDSIDIQQPKYYFRIKGVNFFGEESDPSNMVEIKTYKEVKSFPHIDSLKTILNSMVYLQWSMMDKKETPLIKKYLLGRSDKDAGTYKFIYQNQSVLQFIDKSPLANNFYKVFAITEYNDTLKSHSRMVSISDTIPPAIPKGLKALVDKKGKVTITWSKNKDQDLRGYKLFKANALHEEFVALNEKFITDSFYIDKIPLNNLSHQLFYTLVATDATFNSSQKCEPFKLRRPDTIAPVKPIITDIKLLQHGVKLFFSPSKSEDIELHSLIRSNSKDQSQKTILQFLAKDTITKFIDTSAVLGESYTYSLIAFDEDENKSISFPRHVTFETGFRPTVKDLAAKVDLEKRLISLNWLPYNKETEKYILYRASEKEPYTIIKTLTPNESSFIDKDLNIGNIYFYKIKAVLKNGAESILNNPIKVIF